MLHIVIVFTVSVVHVPVALAGRDYTDLSFAGVVIHTDNHPVGNDFGYCKDMAGPLSLAWEVSLQSCMFHRV